MDPFWQTLVTSSVPAIAAVATVVVGNNNTRKRMQDQWDAEARQRREDTEAARVERESDRAAEQAVLGRAAETARLNSVHASLQSVIGACAAVETHLHHLADERAGTNWDTAVDRDLIRAFRSATQGLRITATDDTDLMNLVNPAIASVDRATLALTTGSQDWQQRSKAALDALIDLQDFIAGEWDQFS